MEKLGRVTCLTIDTLVSKDNVNTREKLSSIHIRAVTQLTQFCSPQQHLSMSGDVCGCLGDCICRGATGIWGGEARDAGKHPPRHRRASTTMTDWPKVPVVSRLRNQALGSHMRRQLLLDHSSKESFSFIRWKGRGGAEDCGSE